MQINSPLVIVCRAHSGGRALCEAFMRNGIQMGRVLEPTKDCIFFGIRSNPLVEELTNMSFEYTDYHSSAKKQIIEKVKSLVNQYIHQDIEDPTRPYGWKFGESLFISPMLMDAFPSCRIIHLIRDGRDVMLSRVPARFEIGIHEQFNELIIFGSERKTHILKEPFNDKLVSKYRNELELIHWQTCVKFGIKCRQYTDQYMEVRYEDFCKRPIDIMQAICNFSGTPLLPSCTEWLKTNITTERIGKWKTLEKHQLDLPMSIAAETLQTLGYHI